MAPENRGNAARHFKGGAAKTTGTNAKIERICHAGGGRFYERA